MIFSIAISTVRVSLHEELWESALLVEGLLAFLSPFLSTLQLFVFASFHVFGRNKPHVVHDSVTLKVLERIDKLVPLLYAMPCLTIFLVGSFSWSYFLYK